MMKETKRELKTRIYEDAKCKAVSNLRAMGAKSDEKDPNCWQGVMQMLAFALRWGNADEKAAAVMASVQWVWADSECKAHAEIAEMGKLIDGEIDALVEAANEDAAASGEPPAEEHAEHPAEQTQKNVK